MVFMTLEAFSIDVLTPADTARALTFFGYSGVDEEALREGLASGTWICLIAVENGVDIGGLYLNAAPKYPVYQRMNLPELQDLRVNPGHRRKGIGETLVRTAEEMVKSAGITGMGVSVGLTAKYGAAQRLYTRLGYLPDGNGVTYDRMPVQHGENRTIGDDLALMLVKFF